MWTLIVGAALFLALAAGRKGGGEQQKGSEPKGLPPVFDAEPQDQTQTQAEALAVVQEAVAAALAAAGQVAQLATSGDTEAAHAACDTALANAQEAASAAAQAGPSAKALYDQAYQALVRACSSIGEPTPTPTELPHPSQVETPKTDIVVKSPGLPQIPFQSPVPDLTPPGTAAPPVPGAGLPAVETSAQLDPNGTVALARLMLERETEPGWKGASSQEVKTWQPKHNLTPDGKFGMHSALSMAQEVGVLPLIRYWPKSGISKSAALKSYREQLNALADAIVQQRPEEAPHATALKLSAAREDARAFANDNPPPVRGTQSVDEIMRQLAASTVGASA